jgi:hypothetical protein
MAIRHWRPRFGDATASVDPPFATAGASRGNCLAGRERSDAAPLWTRAPWTRRTTPSKVFMAFAWSGRNSPSARPARKTSLFGKPALETGRDEKARSVVALSRVPRLAGFAGSPPAAGPLWAVNRPLVRIPANQHTTTGTCEIGQNEKYAIRRALQEFFSETAQPRQGERSNLT